MFYSVILDYKLQHNLTLWDCANVWFACHKCKWAVFQTVVRRNCPEKLCNILERELSLSHSHTRTLTQRRCICFLLSRKEGKLFSGSLTIDWPSAGVGFLKACSGTHMWVCHSPSLTHASQLEMCGFYLAEILQKAMKQNDNSKLLPPGLESSI